MITSFFEGLRSRRPLRARRARLQLEMLEPRLNMALTVPTYSSLPGANHTIYLDFDGNTTTGTSWNSSYGVDPIVSPAYSTDADATNFSTSELTTIERVWRRVSEDFAPFQVNVTTVEPTLEDLRNTGSGDTKWGVRVVVSNDVAFNCGCGGIAYINSFTWNSDTPAFVFNTSELGVSEAASHEVGHTLGLAHDGTSTTSYYQGHGLGTDTAYWGPLMGASYYVDVSQWDNGVYFGTNNGSSSANYNRGPDDLSIITTYNGFGYKTDDHGNTALTASPLTVAGTSVSGSGLITTRTDTDYFQFTTGAGSINLNVNPASLGANLDIEASLFDGNGTLIASANPLMSLGATITATVPAGQYFLRIDGVGAGDPTVSPPTGYTDYASIGQYSIAGTIVGVAGDSLAIAATDAVKSEGNSGTTTFTFTVNRSGDTTGSSTVNYVVNGSGATAANGADFVGGTLPSGTLTFTPGLLSQVVTVSVQGDTTVESDEGFTVSLTNPSATTSISAGAASGTIQNDDIPPALPTLAISATDASKAEGTSTGTTPFIFTITRSGDTSGTSSVNYSVTGTGTSKAAGNDFASGFPTNVTVNFGAGVSAVNVTLNVLADSKKEADEQFKVTLSSAVGATLATSSATGVILNDDLSGRGQGGAGSDSDSGNAILIAVADPLWMFIPPSALTAEQLSVPVVSWVDGVRHLGDFGHMQDEVGGGADEAVWAPGWDALVTFTPLGTFAVDSLRPSSFATRTNVGTEDMLVGTTPTDDSVTPCTDDSDDEAIAESLAVGRGSALRQSTQVEVVETVFRDWSVL